MSPLCLSQLSSLSWPSFLGDRSTSSSDPERRTWSTGLSTGGTNPTFSRRRISSLEEMLGAGWFCLESSMLHTPQYRLLHNSNIFGIWIVAQERLPAVNIEL